MEADEDEERVHHVAMQLGRLAGRVVAHEEAEGSLVQSVHVHRDDAEPGLEEEDGEHRDDGEPAERVVSGVVAGRTLPEGTRVGGNLAHGADERPEAGRLAPHEAPEDAREDEDEEGLPGGDVDVEAPVVPAEITDDHQRDEYPVEDPGRKVPDPDLAQAARSPFLSFHDPSPRSAPPASVLLARNVRSPYHARPSVPELSVSVMSATPSRVSTSFPW